MTFCHWDCICRVREKRSQYTIRNGESSKGYYFNAEKLIAIHAKAMDTYDSAEKNTKPLIVTAMQQLLMARPYRLLCGQR